MPDTASNPLLLILEKITSGIHPSLPKPSSPFAQFVKTNQRVLAPIIARRWNETQTSEGSDITNRISTSQDQATHPTDAFCTRVAIEEFSTLSKADRDSIRDAIDREYLEALGKYNEAVRRIYPFISTYDRSVDTVSDLLQPILSGLEAMTGITFVAWGGGLIRGGLGLFNISSRATSCDEPAEHLMTFPKSEADNFEQSTLNWMHSVHSHFIYDSRCAALEFAEIECSRVPRVFTTPQSAHTPRNSEDLTNGVETSPLEPPQPFLAPTHSIGPRDPEYFTNGTEDPPLDHPQPSLAPTDSIGPVDPEHGANGAEDLPPRPESPKPTLASTNSITHNVPEDFASGGEDLTPEHILPDRTKPVSTPAPLSIKRRIPDDREEADGGDDENQQNAKKMRFSSEPSPQSRSQPDVSEHDSRVNVATSTANHSAQVLPVVINRESVPPISTLPPQALTPRRHSFPRTTQPFPRKPSGTAKIACTGRKSLPPSASAKPSATKVVSAETLASLIKKLPLGDKGFLQGLGSIMKVDLGPAYNQLLIFLVRLEITTHGKSREKFLDRMFRPKEVKEWIHQGRGRNNRILVIDNVCKFAEQWWAWWTILQPKWRAKAKDKHGRPVAVVPSDATYQDWHCMCVPGGNGLICVVAGLYWWGRKLEDAKVNTKVNKENWNKAVNDCLWVLKRIVSSLDKESPDPSSGDALHGEDLGDDAMDRSDPESEGDELDDSDED
ncbi:hypothetical protein Hypma_009868 [Hypsizygus marmoreus]|uniref:Uncharacterized protein n=1 Tax=Hypsizygus marmoreus TaxID=39966 RepID=A0A369JW54_HYPMA|nr:hypothetical protein Hypma_009868 [Hypsizygus marmoreus]